MRSCGVHQPHAVSTRASKWLVSGRLRRTRLRGVARRVRVRHRTRPMKVGPRMSDGFANGGCPIMGRTRLPDRNMSAGR